MGDTYMEYLAIREGAGKGVYLCETKKAKTDILKRYPGCSHRVFPGTGKDDALKWAGAENVSECPETAQGPASSLPQDAGAEAFLGLVEKYRRQGYDGLRVTLPEYGSGNTCGFWINDFWYLNVSRKVREIYTSGIWYAARFGERENQCLTFDEFREKSVVDGYIARHPDDSLRILQGMMKTMRWERNGDGCIRISGARMDTAGPFVVIGESYGHIYTGHDGDGCGCSVVCEDRRTDRTINTAQIVSVIPFRCPYRITDRDYETAAEEVFGGEN